MAQFGDIFGMGKKDPSAIALRRQLRAEHGQILLVVVLTTIVALTVGLSVASRTITNLKLSKENEESQRAFQAAEAGVEEAIKQIGTQENVLDNQLTNSSSFKTTLAEEKSNTFLLNNGDVVQQDLGQDVWLSTYPNYATPSGTPVTIRWGNGQSDCSGGGSNAVAAIEIIMLTGSPASPNVVKHLYDSCGNNRISSGKETPTTVAAPGVEIEGVSFTNSVVLNDANKLIMKVIPLFNSVKIGVEGTAMPSQGNVIESVGSAGSTKRKIVYFESYPQIPPEIFPYTIMSQ